MLHVLLNFLLNLHQFNIISECDNRRFGGNCREQCGSCLNLEQCHHVNGTCMIGCDRGYQGVYCTEGKFSFHIIIVPDTMVLIEIGWSVTVNVSLFISFSTYSVIIQTKLSKNTNCYLNRKLYQMTKGQS